MLSFKTFTQATLSTIALVSLFSSQAHSAPRTRTKKQGNSFVQYYARGAPWTKTPKLHGKNLIAHGGFECDDKRVTDHRYAPFFLPWIFPSDYQYNAVNVIRPANSVEGKSALNLNSPESKKGRVEQKVLTTAGADYYVSMSINGNTNCPGAGAVFDAYVNFGGNKTHRISFNPKIDGAEWRTAVIGPFKTSTQLTKLTIESHTNGPCSILIDDVQVKCGHEICKNDKMEPNPDSMYFSDNLIENGDFEGYNEACDDIDECVLPWSHERSETGSDDTIEVYPSKWYPHEDGLHGNYAIDMNHYDPYAISQNVKVQIGVRYMLSMSVSVNSAVHPTAEVEAKVTVSKHLSTYVKYRRDAFADRWMNVVVGFFVATTEQVKIKIDSLTPGGTGILVDNIQLFDMTNYDD